MVIEVLRQASGDVRTILGRKAGPDGLVDISDDAWGSKLEILRDLTFHRVLLRDRAIGVNFVDCVFRECRFERIRSESQFWASGNSWKKCTFDDLELRDVSSPSNTFEDCRFNGLHLVGYRPSNTLFARCRFDVLWLEGLKTVKAARGAKSIPQVGKPGANLVFFDSIFERARFSNCLFNGVAFEGCEFTEPVVEASDFRGAMGQAWWPPDVEHGDPFVGFLRELLSFIETKFGPDSESHVAISRYLGDYVSGRVTSRDYSGVLYTGTVPDRELDEIEDAMEELEARYPF